MENVLYEAAESGRCDSETKEHPCPLKQAYSGTENKALLCPFCHSDLPIT